jgi:hypothetical protein
MVSSRLPIPETKTPHTFFFFKEKPDGKGNAVYQG